MSDAAMSIAVSALRAQSSNLSIISTNLANASTVGYKEITTNFKTLVTNPYSSSCSIPAASWYRASSTSTSRG